MADKPKSQENFDDLRYAGFIMFWRNDERIDDLPLDTQGFYLQLVKLASHANGYKKFNGVALLAGQYGTSLARISDRLGISIRQVRTHFKRLSDAKIISLESDTRKTIVTICDYSVFHKNMEEERHTKRHTNDTPNDTPTTRIEEECKSLKELKENNYAQVDGVKSKIASDGERGKGGEATFHDFASLNDASPPSEGLRRKKEQQRETLPKKKKPDTRRNGFELRESKKITPELLEYAKGYLTEIDFPLSDDVIQENFRECMYWHEEKGKIPMNPKSAFRNWLKNSINYGKVKKTPTATANPYAYLDDLLNKCGR